MRQPLPIIFLFLLVYTTSTAQMWNGRDTLYGNEWIDYGQTYYKIHVAEDGLYRISYADLRAAGLPVDETAPRRYQLFHLGREIPLHVSGRLETPLQAGDYLEFYGQKNRAELDRYLFQYPEEDLLNPYYSMFTDSSVYFLTVGAEGVQGLRYQEEENKLTDLPAREVWHWDTLLLSFSETYYNKKYAEDLVTFSAYDEGEGFAGRLKNIHQLELRPSGAYSLAKQHSKLNLRLFAERGAHDLQITINDRIVYRDSTIRPYSFHILEFDVLPEELKQPIQLTIKGRKGNRDTYALASISLEYPAEFLFPEASFYAFRLPAADTRRYIKLKGLPDPPSEVSLYDTENRIRMIVKTASGGGELVWPATGRDAQIVADLNPENIRAQQLRQVVFRDLGENAAQYLIISHPSLEAGAVNQIRAYADYRSSAAGGGYSTEVFDVAELYDQFGYGIEQHTQALRNFGFFARSKWPDLRYILLLGHAVDHALIRDEDDPGRQQNLVPTFGSPGSDNLLFAPNGSSVSIAAVGRVAAENPKEVEWYLNKVVEHEAGLRGALTVEQQGWRKRVLHLVGGNNTEKAGFQRRLDDAGAELEANTYGAELQTIARSSNDPVSSSLSQEVIDALNEGVGIKTFLGHGGVTTTDFGLDDPELFDNAGKYPLMFSLGCLSGYTSDFQNSLSERFVLAPRRGGIAYIASAGFASAGPLSVTTKTFYDLIGGELYGHGLGKVLNEVRKVFDRSQNIYYRSLMQQFFYHGDPALKINRVPERDYLIDINSVSFEPSVASTSTDTMEVIFTLANIGAVHEDSVVIAFTHETPSGAEFVYQDTVLTGDSFKELHFRFPLNGKNSRGINRLFMLVDPENEIREGPAPAAEQNNELSGASGAKGVSFFVTDQSLEAVYPTPYHITRQKPLTLNAVPVDIFAKNIDLRLEVDTTALFNSPEKYSRLIAHDGGMLEHQPDIDWMADQVYYWRVSPDSASNPGLGYQWNTNSFLFRPGSGGGWNQSHYFQLAENSFDGIRARLDDRSFPYAEVLTAVTAFAEIFSLEENNVTSRIFLDNSRVVRNWPPPSLGILVLHPITGKPENQRIFRLDKDDTRREAIAFLTAVPEDYYVTLVTFREKNQTYGLEQWMSDSTAAGNTLFGLLEAEGATLIRDLEALGEPPYAIAYQKGKGVLRERIGNPEDFTARIYFEIPSLLEEGNMTSPLIGPARDWDRLEWRVSELEPGEDSIAVQIYGLATPEADPVLLWTGTEERLPLDFIAHQSYPYLQLELSSSDSTQRSAPQLDYWRVYYEEAGDLVFDPGNFHQDTLQRGETLRLDYQVHNFAPGGSTDSLPIRFTIIDSRNNTYERLVKLAPVPGMERISGTFTFDTKIIEAGGDCQLSVEVDPEQRIAERSRLNNTGVKSFHLLFDRKAPVLDVTFDGRHIMDGDLVNGRPFIVITLQDENPYFPIRDTTAFSIHLVYPGGTRKRVNFQDEGVMFYPAEAGEANKARVELQPELTESGTYTLQVNGRDEPGNKAGVYDYTVSFEVDFSQRISNVLPYPNPFSTSTRFSYTMTGTEEPAYFLIQIMTVSGKVVREITKEEFGPLRVGTHLSDFVWDGRDNFGDRLANGVYLYRVVVKDEKGEDYERYEQSTDRFFKKNIGKIVILR